ncbi:MAG: glycyl tRNA synthetase, partial [Parcubacteria group bacterium]|nr:glycyl tRNA synthetase [Parcubacteria group bacterium]
PLGVALKKNIENLWWRTFVEERDDMYGLDAAILMNSKAWEASGHVAGFSDPLVECSNCKKRFRADHLEDPNVCPGCGKKGTLGEARQFNMMFKTQVGATEDETAAVYLRPETAGGIFVNFKNVVDSAHPKLPFGIAQIGKAFRNEIAPRDFIFRVRELEQMEVEYFVRSNEWETAFEDWRARLHAFAEAIGLPSAMVHELEVGDGDRAHYSKRTIDFEFDYPFGRKELWGLAYRTDFDLTAHQEHSTVKLEYLDESTGEKFIPHVIEPSLGVGRTLLAVLVAAYEEDELGGEKRSVLKLSPRIAPIKAMVSPLLKNKPELVEKAREVRAALKKVHPAIAWDDNGNIGKRYRRQDEIGTPFCITIDFDTLGENPELKDTVTLRHRDTSEQERLSIEAASEKIRAALA